MHKRMNPREQKRMMQRMGMNMDSVPDVQQVIIRTSSKDIVIDEPEVAILEVRTKNVPNHRRASFRASSITAPKRSSCKTHLL